MNKRTYRFPLVALTIFVTVTFILSAASAAGRPRHRKAKPAAKLAPDSSLPKSGAAEPDKGPGVIEKKPPEEKPAGSEGLNPAGLTAPVNGEAEPQNPVATVEFTFERPGAHPQQFTVTIKSSGTAAYWSCNATCKGQPMTAADAVSTEMATSAGEDPFSRTFAVTQKTREMVFALAASANYFDGSFDFTKHRIANTGAKSLAYSDGAKKFSTTYNWSENRDIQQLTDIFLNISATQEGGRRLQFLQRFDKLGLEEELKSLQSLSHDKRLAEVESITPVLRTIVADRAVMHVTRERAQKLLDATASDPAAQPADKPKNRP